MGSADFHQGLVLLIWPFTNVKQVLDREMTGYEKAQRFSSPPQCVQMLLSQLVQILDLLDITRQKTLKERFDL